MICGQKIRSGAAACAALLLLHRCGAVNTGGSVAWRGSSTTFLTKFCYTYNPEGSHQAGRLDLTVHAPAEAHHQPLAFVMLFDDEEDSFGDPSGEWLSASWCQERMQHARQLHRVNWTQASQPSGQSMGFRIRQKVRPRWWYVALTACSGSGKGFDDGQIHFNAHMVNTGYGWASEFSTDRRYVLPVVVALACMYSCLTAAQLLASRTVAQDAKDDSASGKAAHPFARILAAGLSLALGETLLSAAHFARFAHDGSGFPVLQVLAQLLGVASNFLLASLLLLVSQGKCVSYIMVASDAWRMLRLLGPFSIACFGLELWAECALSRNYTTDYVYTTPFGWALISVDIFFLAVYLQNLRKTFAAERERDDGIFYRTWGLVYGAWFLALPLTAVLAQAVLAPYAWFMVSLGVKKGATALAYSALVVGLWPGNARTYFRLEAAVDACSAAAGAWCHGGHPRPDAAEAEAKSGALPRLLGGLMRPRPEAKPQRVGAREPSLGMLP